MDRKQRIKDLVTKIQKGNKEGKKQEGKAVNPVNPTVSKKPAKVKSRRLYIGWLHRTSSESRYKQIKTKDGGGVRDMYYKEDEDISVESLQMMASKLFFPQGVSKYGALEDMKIELGNYAQESVSVFCDLEGNQCTFPEYLKSRGLFASKCYVYLMSTLADTKECSPRRLKQAEDSGLESTPLEEKAEKVSSPHLDAFMGCSKTQMSEEFQNLGMKTSTPVRSEPRSQTPLYAPVSKEGEGTLCTVENVGDHRLVVTYESLQESSYSEVTLTSVTFSREQCFEMNCFSEPLTRDLELDEYDPLENGFTVVGISKGEICFLDKVYDESEPDEHGLTNFRYEFPVATKDSSGLILHHPSEVWGYDGHQLIIGVVVSCHMALNARFVWYRNGSKIKEGHPFCCLAVTEPGDYSVEVFRGEEREMSNPIKICRANWSRTSRSSLVAKAQEQSLNEGTGDESNATQQLKQKENPAAPSVPVVDKEEITLFNEIGRGSFAVVYKASWAGTDVAVKVLKMRSARRLQSVIETEVRVHGMIRHPNVVQIMAVSILKNSIYIVSEYIEGLNLEEVIFGDGERSTTITLEGHDRVCVGRQISQAVAYLHNLKPPVVHRDIKPANVLVAKGSLVTKLCDMGLSKVKSAQSLSQTSSTTIPGSPSYMAPECLLEKKKATVHSDVWSLACTLLELFTERDCWEHVFDEKSTSNREDGDDASQVTSLISAMKRRETPAVLESIDAPLQNILADCFKYEIDHRPRAIDIVNALLQ